MVMMRTLDVAWKSAQVLGGGRHYDAAGSRRWRPCGGLMPGLGDDARGITMLFDFRGVQNTPRGAQPDATPVAPDTRYRNVRHL